MAGFSFGEMAGTNRKCAALEKMPSLIQDDYEEAHSAKSYEIPSSVGGEMTSFLCFVFGNIVLLCIPG